jgi:hypothetical protein
VNPEGFIPELKKKTGATWNGAASLERRFTTFAPTQTQV